MLPLLAQQRLHVAAAQLPELEAAERRQDVVVQPLSVLAQRARLDLTVDGDQPALGILPERDVSIRRDGEQMLKLPEHLERVLMGFLFGGEQRAVTHAVVVAVVDLPHPATLAEADLELGGGHRDRRA